MRIRFLVSIASVEHWSYTPGDEAEFPDKQARSFIAGGIAEAVDTTDAVPPIETATAGRAIPVPPPDADEVFAPPPKKKGK